MIVKKHYIKYDHLGRRSERIGWFLFGFIPLYISKNEFHW